MPEGRFGYFGSYCLNAYLGCWGPEVAVGTYFCGGCSRLWVYSVEIGI